MYCGQRTNEVAFEPSIFTRYAILTPTKKTRKGETFEILVKLVYANPKSTSFWPHQCALSTDYVVVVVMIMWLMGWDEP